MIDKRKKFWRNRYRNLAIAFLLSIALIILLASFNRARGHTVDEMLNPDARIDCCSTTNPKCKIYIPIPEPVPTPETPLEYIRWKGELEGYNEYDISKFIRIARAESYFHLDPEAQNPHSTASGIYMFTDGTWARYCVGDKLDFIDSVNCFYHVLESDGYPKGLSHWNASRNKWE